MNESEINKLIKKIEKLEGEKKTSWKNGHI